MCGLGLYCCKRPFIQLLQPLCFSAVQPPSIWRKPEIELVLVDFAKLELLKREVLK